MRKQREKRGRDIKEPTIIPANAWLWEAFCFLSVRRLVINGASQSIQMSEIASYHQYHRLPEGWRKKLLTNVIDRLDSFYLEHMRKQAERNKGKGSGTRQMSKPGVR